MALSGEKHGRAPRGSNLESDFAAALERHRRELQVHCYRMLGSFEDSEDLVQETFLRAWRQRASFHGGSLRAWLYRIATNACLDVLRRTPPRVTPPEVAAAGDPTVAPAPPADLPWLQPHPDGALEPIAATEEGPGRVVVAKETIELAFLAAIQHLPPRQRAVLILRDVVGWSTKETASLLESEPRLRDQRAAAGPCDSPGTSARAADGWPRATAAEEELGILRRYVDAHLKADSEALAELLREDARLTMPPIPSWYEGREAIMTSNSRAGTRFGQLRSLGTSANTCRRPLSTCGGRPRASTGRSPSMCCGSRVDGSPRSPRSSIQNCSRSTFKL